MSIAKFHEHFSWSIKPSKALIQKIKSKPKNSRIVVGFILLAITACGTFDSKIADFSRYRVSSDSIRYTGRIRSVADSVTIFWPGTMIEFRFTGQSAKALLRDEASLNYFNVIVDGKFQRYFKLDLSKKYYTLANNLGPGEHTIQLIKRTEWDKGATWFYGLEIGRGTLLAPPAQRKRTLEFFGDSITAGYAIENYTGEDSPDSIYTNNYHTYAAIAARHFDANYYCTVKSGIGITVSWFPLIMPEMYDRLDPRDSTSKWDFSKVTPDVVVINLFQNDSWLVRMPEHQSFRQRFGFTPPTPQSLVAAYQDFVQNIRQKYPQARIICALGNMDATKPGSPWPGYVSQAVTNLADQKIYTLFFPFMNKGGHPRKEDNEAMAKILIAFIEKELRW